MYKRQVYASQLDYEDAIPFFAEALEDPKYKTGYKAYMGLGNAYLKLGKSAEAGASFRSAALDESNPDPTKALLNLGVCFMEMCIRDSYEPYLMQQGLLVRTPKGRQATRRAFEHIGMSFPEGVL